MNQIADAEKVVLLRLEAGLAVQHPGRLSRRGVLKSDLIERVDGARCGKGFPQPNLQPDSVLVVLRGTERLTLSAPMPMVEGGNTQPAAPGMTFKQAKLTIDGASNLEQLRHVELQIYDACARGELSKNEASLPNLIERRKQELRAAARAPQLPLSAAPTSTTPPPRVVLFGNFAKDQALLLRQATDDKSLSDPARRLITYLLNDQGTNPLPRERAAREGGASGTDGVTM